MKVITRLSLGLTAGLTFLIGSVLLGTTTADAKVIQNSFLTTQRTIHTTNSKKQVQLSLPKGTTVQAAKVKNQAGRKYIYINAEQLSYRLRKPLLSSKVTSNFSRWIPVTKANFKQVKTPVYLSYYNTNVRKKRINNRYFSTNSNLWQGDALPADYPSQSGTRLRITTDGYLEYFAKSPFVYRVSKKPTATLKVQSATHPSGSGKDIMIFKSSFSPLPFQKAADGAYTLTIRWLSAATVTAIPNENNVKELTHQYVSKIGEQNWYHRTSTTKF